MSAATEEDWGREYLDYMISVKTVSSLDEAIAHINRYNTGHSEAIITENYTNAQRFLDEIDAAWRLCQTHRRVFQTDLNLDLARRSASVPRSFMQEDRWDWMR